MKTYSVTVAKSLMINYEVKAYSQEDAEEKATNFEDLEFIQSWDEEFDIIESKEVQK